MTKYYPFLFPFLLISFIFSAFILTKSKTLNFELLQSSNEKFEITIDDAPVIMINKFIIPTTLTTTRPVKVSISGKSQMITFPKINKLSVVPVNFHFKDKSKDYLILTRPPFLPQLSTKGKFPEKGYILISFHGLQLVDPSYSLVLDAQGNILYYRGNPELNRSMFNLKKIVLPQNKIRYITHVQNDAGITLSWVRGYYLIMDEKFNVIDKVKLLPTNKHPALLADEHDLLMIDDGHYIAIGYNVKDTILPNGKKSQIVHNVIQEQKDGKVLLDWNSEDYPFLQNTCYEKCPQENSRNADYVHTNSLFIDPQDENIILSSASGYFVMKIERHSGKIIWILGGKNDNFRIPKENIFLRQHAVYFNDEHKLIILDNQFSVLPPRYYKNENILPPLKYSRVLSFDIDEKNKKINSIEQFPLDFKIEFMGSAEKLENGNWLIGCGSSYKCAARVINTKGKILWQLNVQQPYKTFRTYYIPTLY